jgi:hypothetical protein
MKQVFAQFTMEGLSKEERIFEFRNGKRSTCLLSVAQCCVRSTHCNHTAKRHIFVCFQTPHFSIVLFQEIDAAVVFFSIVSWDCWRKTVWLVKVLDAAWAD